MKEHFPVVALMFCAIAPVVRAGDASAELASFSVFDSVDLADLAKTDAKVAHGPPMNGRYVSVQSVWVAPGEPAGQIEAIRNFDPTKHRELKVYIHGDLPASPDPSDFAQLDRPPQNGAVKALQDATKKVSSELQISRDEAAKLSGGSGLEPWKEILAARAKSFVSGGAGAQPAYDHSGDTVRPNDEFNALLRQQDKIRKQFSGLLGAAGVGRSSPKADSYFELIDADNEGVVTLGAFAERSNQAADVLYYASGGYYVALTVYQFWPVDVNGKASTLVWRGDLISSASLASLHGVERLASESALMKDVTKMVTALRHDSGR
jgi:hypothetical protein